MKAFDIAFLMTGDLHRNIRALKQLRSLSLAGYQVAVFHLGGSAQRVVLPEGVSETVVHVPPSRGPAFFKAVDSAFKHAVAAIQARLYHASDLYVLPACSTASTKWGAPYSFDSRELYAHVAATRGRPWVRWWWTRLEKKYLPGAACIFTVSDSIADFLATKYQIDRPVVVHNTPEQTPQQTAQPAPNPAPQNAPPIQTPHQAQPAPNTNEAAPGARVQTMKELMEERDLPSNVPILVHLGQMKLDRGCRNLILAMKQVPKAHLVFLGFGSIEQDLKKLVSKHHLSRTVHFIPPVAPRAVHAALQGATIGITMLEDSCLNHRFALPNKLFDYVHAGIPVLGSHLTEVKSFITKYQVGKTADPNNPASIAHAINEMISSDEMPRWKENALKITETFSWDKASQRFMDEITRVLS